MSEEPGKEQTGEFTEAEKSILRKSLIGSLIGAIYILVASVAALSAAIFYRVTALDIDIRIWVAFLLLLIVGSSYTIYTSRPIFKVLAPSAQARIADIRKHMGAAGKLMRELEDELSTRTQVLEQLQADAERYEQLASLNAEQAKAIDDMVDRKFKRQERITWGQWWGAIILAGVLGFLVNWASSPLWDWITR